MKKNQGDLINQSKKVTEFSFATVHWADEDSGILYTKSKPTNDLTIEDMANAFEIYNIDYKHPRRKLLADVAKRNNLSKQARNFVLGPEGVFNYFEAIAVLDKSGLSATALIANIIIKIIPLRKPVKVFHNEQEAIDWLKKI